ncbi:MAG TPA: DinB family protein [Dehalococcoidia bacterium]|nr:DinB family protein [Dehalococcoidia bacterium]
MTTSDDVREQVLSSFRGATDRRFEEAVKDFPAEFMNAKPPNVDYTPWQLLEHLRISQLDILDYVRNPDYKSPPWPDGYWPAKGATADTAAWAASVERFRADRQAIEALAGDPKTDLLAPMPHTPGHTLLREVLLDAGHSSYHLGEFGILRQVMLTWPPGHK